MGLRRKKKKKKKKKRGYKEGIELARELRLVDVSKHLLRPMVLMLKGFNDLECNFANGMGEN